MRLSNEQLDEVQTRGFCRVEGFLSDNDLKAAQDGLWSLYPRPDDYFANPDQHAWLQGNPFAGVREFPFGHPGLDLAADNPDLIDAMERLCGTADVEITKTDCWAKYAGAADYTQRHHRDLIYQSMVVPQLASDQHQYQAFFLLSDVTEDDAPLIMVPRDVSTDTPLWHDELPEDAYAAVEIPMTGPAGTLILFRTDSLHRGSNFKAANRSRFILFVDFQARGRPWDGKTHWAQRAWQPNWTKAITALSPRARCLFGFPAPSDPYWDDQTIRDVGARYPAMDMTPYKPDDPDAFN